MVKKEETLISLNGVTVPELLAEVQKRGYYVAKTPEARRGRVHQGDLKRWRGNKYKFGVVSDTHCCSRYQQLTHLKTFYRICALRRIGTIFHCGDVGDGEKVYRGHEYELFVHGFGRQRDYIVDNYPKSVVIKTLAISGNHDQSFFKTSGANLVESVACRRNDIVYLGDDYAVVKVGKNLKVALMHGRGGVAYARSYKIQKVVEQISSENKPHLLFMGHYHVPNHTPGYRNVEAIQMSCFQAQTPYLVAKGLQPFVAGLIVTVQEDESGLAKVIYEWIPFYKAKKDDF